MSVRPKSVLSDDARDALQRLARGVARRRVSKSDLAHVVAGLDLVEPAKVAAAGREIVERAQLYWYYRRPGLWDRLQSRLGGTERDLLARHPGLEHLFVFHGSGRLREAALNRFQGGADSAYVFVAIAMRLNDWVLEVRQAAAACARRVFPGTAPAIVAEAALFLLDRKSSWGRWTGERALVDEAFERADVLQHLAEAFRTARTGAMTVPFAYCARLPAFDDRLPELAAGAFQPAIRAAALRILIDGRARWPTGLAPQWIDKTQRKVRMVPTFAEREVARPCALEDLIAQGARDRNATVRKVAADGLIGFRAALPDAGALARRLAADPNKGVRERAEFVLRKLGES